MAETSQMQNRALARFALFVGGFAAVVGWWAFAAQHTILDPTATRDAAFGLLQAKPIQSKARDSLINQINQYIPPSLVGASTTKVRAATTAALSDDRVQQAFADGIGSFHRQLLTNVGTPQKLSIDTAAVTAAVHDSLAQQDPALAKWLRGKSLSIEFNTSSVPNLHGVTGATPLIALIASLTAIALWGAAILLHPDHPVAVRKIGRRLIGIGAMPVVFWVILPALLERFHADAAQLFSPLARSYGKRLALPAVIILLIGCGVWVGGRLGTPTGGSTPSPSNRGGSADDASQGRAPTRGKHRRLGRDNVGVKERLDLRL